MSVIAQDMSWHLSGRARQARRQHREAVAVVERLAKGPTEGMLQRAVNDGYLAGHRAALAGEPLPPEVAEHAARADSPDVA